MQELPWYKSRIIVSALVSISMKILVATGVLEEIGIDEDAITDAALLIIGGIADLWIIFSRANQTVAPAITLTNTNSPAGNKNPV